MNTFEELYTEFDSILNYFTYKYLNIDCMEDILQDCYVLFYQKYLDKWDPSKSELRTYFIGLVTMKCLYYLRYQKKNNTCIDDVEIASASAEEVDNNFNDDRMKVLNIIVSDLSYKEKYQYKLLQLWVSGLKYDQIALNEQIELHKVKNSIRRIRIVICEKYNSLTGQKIIFAKNKDLNKDKKFYLENKDKIKEKYRMKVQGS